MDLLGEGKTSWKTTSVTEKESAFTQLFRSLVLTQTLIFHLKFPHLNSEAGNLNPCEVFKTRWNLNVYILIWDVLKCSLFQICAPSVWKFLCFIHAIQRNYFTELLSQQTGGRQVIQNLRGKSRTILKCSPFVQIPTPNCTILLML